MSDIIKDGGPAFPFTRTELRNGQLGHDCMCTGMSLRDWYAGQALAGLIGDGIVNASIPALASATGRDAAWRDEIIQAVVKSAYDISDAMLTKREKRSA